MIRATMGTSRSTNHWKSRWMVGQGPTTLEVRWGAQDAWSLIFTLFFEGVFFRFFSMLGRFWEVLGAKMEAKIDFWEKKFDAFFESVLASILDGFLKPQDLKISDFPIGKPQISQNRRFRKSPQKWSVFNSPKHSKIHQKIKKYLM